METAPKTAAAPKIGGPDMTANAAVAAASTSIAIDQARARPTLEATSPVNAPSRPAAPRMIHMTVEAVGLILPPVTAKSPTERPSDDDADRQHDGGGRGGDQSG